MHMVVAGIEAVAATGDHGLRQGVISEIPVSGMVLSTLSKAKAKLEQKLGKHAVHPHSAVQARSHARGDSEESAAEREEEQVRVRARARASAGLGIGTGMGLALTPA